MPYSSPQQRAAVWAKHNQKSWDEPITAGNTLTKREVHDYYNDPVIQQRILATLANRDLVAIQSRSPDNQILRRYEKQDKPIRVTSTKDLARLTKQRFTEFHPTVGERTNEVWVDIDAGKNRSTESLKPIALDVEKQIRKLPGVQGSGIAFSGGSGFHVRARLDEEQPTSELKRALERKLREVLKQHPDTTMRPPDPDEVRLDISTFHDKGSLRAPYSINAQTGLVAVPLTHSELKTFDPQRDALPSTVQGQEFAPGIPKEKKTYDLPDLTNRHWTLAIQQHDARKAGKHWDLRLVDPDTTHAHSWAVPKAQLPDKSGKPILAVRTPTHTARYALGFGAEGPKEIKKGYGAGVVEILHKEPVRVLSSSPNKLKFERTVDGSPEQYMLFKTKGDAWLMKRTKEAMVHSAFDRGRFNMLIKLGVASPGVSKEPSISEMDNPVDNQDDELPAGMLARALSKVENPPKRNLKSEGEDSIEDRLNRNVTWTEPSQIPYEFATGPSPIMPGNF